MPTTTREADKIVQIMSKYLKIEDAACLIEDLFESVALNTCNYSVRSSIFMLKRILDPDFVNRMEVDVFVKLSNEWEQMLTDESLSNWHSVSKVDWLGLTSEEYQTVSQRM